MAENLLSLLTEPFTYISYLLFFTVLFLNIVWIVYLAGKVCKIYAKQKEQTLNSHPSCLDDRSKLKLYNYRTHVTKYALMGLCSVGEVLTTFGMQ